MKHIEIPVTQMMEDDLKDCEKASKDGREKDCDFCSLNGGEMYGCMADYRWTDDGERKRKMESVRKAVLEIRERITLMESDNGNLRGQVPEYYGALKMAAKALEKQLPIEPSAIVVDGVRIAGTYTCPECGAGIIWTGADNYCSHCGQALDWTWRA